MLYFILSWRNLWRNGKRTLIAATSVFFAVLLAVVMRSGQNGSYAYMIDSSAKLFTGYLQVQAEGYWDNPSLDKSIALSDAQLQRLVGIRHVTGLAPRLETYALVSGGNSTKVAQIIGIDPVRENAMTGLRGRLVAGRYLTAAGETLLIGQGLAEVLRLGVGDHLVIYGQGYHGQTAAARVEVGGIVKLPFPEMNNSLVYLPLAQAREIFSAPGRITAAVLMADSIRHLAAVRQNVARLLGAGEVVMSWDEMQPDLVQNIELDNASGLVMLVILYIVIAFGVFGTVTMMTSERRKEFGILISVGMSKTRLVLVTTLETVFISFLGVVAGIAGSIPVVAYLHFHPLRMSGEAAKAFTSIGIEPIMNFSLDPSLFLYQASVVLLIALATAVYPVLFIKKLRPETALHG